MADSFYPALAYIVNHVRSRTDTDHVLRELVGQYALQQKTLSSTLRLFAWLKLLFDAQCAALGDAHLYTSWMSPSSTLVSTLLFLIDTKKPRRETHSLSPEAVEEHSPTLCTLLSGIRLLRVYLAQKNPSVSADQ